MIGGSMLSTIQDLIRTVLSMLRCETVFEREWLRQWGPIHSWVFRGLSTSVDWHLLALLMRICFEFRRLVLWVETRSIYFSLFTSKVVTRPISENNCWLIWVVLHWVFTAFTLLRQQSLVVPLWNHLLLVSHHLQLIELVLIEHLLVLNAAYVLSLAIHSFLLLRS